MQTKTATLGTLVILATLAATAMLVGCGGGEAPRQAQTPVVSVITVGTDSVVLTTELAGRTVPCQTADIRPQVNGLILKRLYTEGSDVEEGQSLYTIDPAPYQAALANAKAALARAEANLTAAQSREKRAQELLPTRAVSQQDYDDAVSALKQAEAEVASWQAQVKTARINLDYTDVRSPISGRIGRSLVTVGQVVTAYQPQPLAVVRQLDPIYVDMPQSATAMLRLQRELADGRLHAHDTGEGNVAVILADSTTYELRGRLEFRDVSVDPSTGSVVLRAIFPNPKTGLLPDLFVRGVVTEGLDPVAVVIPQQAVARNAKGEPYCWIVDADSHAQVRPLTIDRAVGNRWMVTSGIEAGATLVVDGLQYLRQPGQPVKTEPFTPAAAAGAPAAGGAGHTDQGQAH